MLTVSESAARYLQEILAEEPTGTIVRLAPCGSCAGTPVEIVLDDVVFSFDAKEVIDGISFVFAENLRSTVDEIHLDLYQDGLDPFVTAYRRPA